MAKGNVLMTTPPPSDYPIFPGLWSMDINVGHFRQHHTQKMAIISLQQEEQNLQSIREPSKNTRRKKIE